jgi:hypothetical protein
MLPGGDERPRLRLDGEAEAEHRVRIAGKDAALLLFEKMQEPAVVGEFSPKGLRDDFPL